MYLNFVEYNIQIYSISNIQLESGFSGGKNKDSHRAARDPV